MENYAYGIILFTSGSIVRPSAQWYPPALNGHLPFTAIICY